MVLPCSKRKGRYHCPKTALILPQSQTKQAQRKTHQVHPNVYAWDGSLDGAATVPGLLVLDVEADGREFEGKSLGFKWLGKVRSFLGSFQGNCLTQRSAFSFTSCR
jgi:hypothetical protein